MRVSRKDFISMSGKAAALSALSRFGFFDFLEDTAYAQDVLNSSEVRRIHRHIEEQKAEHVAKIQEYLRQPSVSTTGEGIKECAELLRSYFKQGGAREAEVVPTGGHPAVWGYFDAGAAKTIVSYFMYDTVPFEAEKWSSPPLAADLVEMKPFEKVIIAVGAINNKGYERAYLNAIESIVAVAGKLPVNIMITADGEEEIGSPNFPKFIEKYIPKLKKANGMLKPRPAQDANGNVNVYLGYRGVASMELRSSGALWGRGPQARPIEGAFSPVVESPVWRLIEALNTLAEEAGTEPVIEGYEVSAISEEDRELLKRLAQVWDASSQKNDLGIRSWARDASGKELTTGQVLERMLYAPTFNINGLSAGYTGPLYYMVLPNSALAKVESRFPLGMNSDQVFKLVRSHLEKRGYGDIEVKPLSVTGWSKTSVKEPVVQAVLALFKHYGKEPVVWPHVPYGSPEYLYTGDPLNLPAAQGALGHGGRMHSVDEYFVIDGNEKVGGLVEYEKSAVDLLYLYANWPEG